jgi:succinate dehydrogenase/fumarate reductase flavoprotein subunit
VTNGEAIETLSTDVLVIGGGPAGTWAAIKAAQAGADVVLARRACRRAG